jgi:hypothetical protein
LEEVKEEERKNNQEREGAKGWISGRHVARMEI